MEYSLLKLIHIVSSTLLFGTGLGSAFYKWMADKYGDLDAIVQTNRTVVIADWCFTTPTIIIQPITGVWLAYTIGIPLDQPWLIAAAVLYLFAGACWIPVVWLQIRMRDLSAHAHSQGGPLTDQYLRYARLWFWLGVPAFAAVIAIFFLMVFKPSLSL